jgi:hypothetical protein
MESSRLHFRFAHAHASNERKQRGPGRSGHALDVRRPIGGDFRHDGGGGGGGGETASLGDSFLLLLHTLWSRGRDELSAWRLEIGDPKSD